jgi:membrane protein
VSALWARLRRFLTEGLWATDLEARPWPVRAGLRALRLALAAGAEFQAAELGLRATGLVYTTLLSLVPFLAVSFSVLKAFGAHHLLEPTLAGAFAPLGAESARVTREVLGFVDNLRVGLLGAAGVAGLFYTAISLVSRIEDALNYVWRARRARSLARRFTDYLSVLLVGPVLVAAALALTAGAENAWVVGWILAMEPVGPLLLGLANWVVPVLCLAAAFTFLYRFLPCTRVGLRSALVGGLTAAALCHVAGVWFTLFVARSPQYAAIYSGFAVLVAFLVWLDVAWLIFLAGSVVAYCHQHPPATLAAAGRRGPAPPAGLALATLAALTRRHAEGGGPVPPAELARRLRVPPGDLDDAVTLLVRRGLVLRAAEPEGLALARAPERVPLAEVLAAVRDPDAPAPPGPPGGPVARLLARVDGAVAGAVADLTLRSLEAGPDPPPSPSAGGGGPAA